jgi:HPt (histidine-containing phosphotransfer) domain-containing protein
VSKAPAATPTPAATPDSDEPLHSAFADDPDMQDVIREFVDRLPGQVAKMLQLIDTHNLDELRRAVHQMKGAGGGYGFSQITHLAARAEQTVKEGGTIEAISQQVDGLVRLIRRVQGYDLRREDPTNTPTV